MIEGDVSSWGTAAGQAVVADCVLRDMATSEVQDVSSIVQVDVVLFSLCWLLSVHELKAQAREGHGQHAVEWIHLNSLELV